MIWFTNMPFLRQSQSVLRIERADTEQFLKSLDGTLENDVRARSQFVITLKQLLLLGYFFMSINLTL